MVVRKCLQKTLNMLRNVNMWLHLEYLMDMTHLISHQIYLWRGKLTFAIAQHKHHKNIYEEADSNKRRKRYARPLIDRHIVMRVWSLGPHSSKPKVEPTKNSCDG